MEQRTYHGKITTREVAEALLGRFHGDDMSVAMSGDDDKIMLNISSAGWQGGRTALAVGLSQVSAGVMVTVGEHSLLGVAADLLQTGLGALRNPLTIIGEIDDVARNVERLNLPAQVWETVDHYARSVGAGSYTGSDLGGLPVLWCPQPHRRRQVRVLRRPSGPLPAGDLLALWTDVFRPTPSTARAAERRSGRARRRPPAPGREQPAPSKPKIVAKFS